jgi:hypothetical protein
MKLILHIPYINYGRALYKNKALYKRIISLGETIMEKWSIFYISKMRYMMPKNIYVRYINDCLSQEMRRK